MQMRYDLVPFDSANKVWFILRIIFGVAHRTFSSSGLFAPLYIGAKMARHKKGALRLGKLYLIRVDDTEPRKAIYVDLDLAPIFYDYKSQSIVAVHSKNIIGEIEDGEV
jgi:hypothetical protein